MATSLSAQTTGSDQNQFSLDPFQQQQSNGTDTDQNSNSQLLNGYGYNGYNDNTNNGNYQTGTGNSNLNNPGNNRGIQGQYGQQTIPGLYNNNLQQYGTYGRRFLAPEPLTEFQRMVAAMTGRTVAIFGASIFRSDVPSTFAPVLDLPVGSDYVIGPGDELRLQIWGQVNLQGSFIVDRSGNISVPQAGSIHVAGQRYDQLDPFLRNQLDRVYRNFNLNVTMGRLRTIQVFIVGQARVPGSYTVSSMSTLLNALFASGGPTAQGSLRDIQVRRGAQTITHFDLYDLLLNGDKSKDVPLLPGDVIFIPAVGPQVALVGSVNTPAIYELKKPPAEITAADLIGLGGGRTSIAGGTEVRVERIVNHSALTVEDVDLTRPENTSLQNGDIVSVISMVDRVQNAVTLRGNVANSGRYVWHSGMHVSDLIPDKDALLTRDYWLKRNKLGQMPETYPPQFLAQNEYQNLNQQNRYQGQLQGRYQGQGQGQIAGQVIDGNQYQNPNQSQIQDQSLYYGQNQNQSDTGLMGSGSNQGGEGVGGGGTNNNYTRNPNRTSQGGEGGGSVASALTAEEGAFGIKNFVELSAPDVDWSYAVIERQSANDLTTKLISFNLGKVVLDKDQSQNIELLPGDVVTIFSTADLRVPTSQQTRFVRLEGEFASAGIYSVNPGETLRQLVQRAGGFTPDAYLYASSFTRLSTKRVEQQRINEYADQLEAQVYAQTSSLAQNAIGAQDVAAANAAAATARASILRLRQQVPEGRIVLQLKPDSQGVDSIPDIALEDGDRFVVPKAPADVYVQGQVYSSNAFVYEPGRSMKDYLKIAGGPGRQADTSRTLIVRADGSVSSGQYGNLEKAMMYPGDTILVPLKVDRRSTMRNLLDISQILSQFGVGIAAINLLK